MNDRSSVVVISSDGSFRRLAGAALTRAGHDVRTMTARPWRIQRLLHLLPPDVVVLDLGDEHSEEIEAHVLGLADPPGMVYATEDGDETRPLTVQKWGPLDALVDHVGLALRSTAVSARKPPLRLIHGGS